MVIYDSHVKEFYKYYAKNELKFQRYKKKSYTMALEIIRINPVFICHVKKELQSNDMCKIAIDYSPHLYTRIHNPSALITLYTLQHCKDRIGIVQEILTSEKTRFNKDIVNEILKIDTDKIFPLLNKKLDKNILTEDLIIDAFKKKKTASIFHVGYREIPDGYLTESIINTVIHSAYNKFNVRIAECYGSSFLEREIKRLKLLNGPPSVY